DVAVAHNQPNGMNINDGCGSIHPEEIQRIVKISSADVGISHDGDADRVLLCDEDGEIVDGDEILAIAALDLLDAGRLEQNKEVLAKISSGPAQFSREREASAGRTGFGDEAGKRDRETAIGQGPGASALFGNRAKNSSSHRRA